MGVRISKPKHFVPLNARVIIYNSLILSHLNYCIFAWIYRCETITQITQPYCKNYWHMQEYSKTYIQCNIPNTINNTTTIIIDKLYTHSMPCISGYIKQCFLHSYQNIVQSQTAIYVPFLRIRHTTYLRPNVLILNSIYNYGVSVSLENRSLYLLHISLMFTVTMCTQNKCTLGMVRRGGCGWDMVVF